MYIYRYILLYVLYIFVYPKQDKASQDKEDMRLLTDLLNQYAQSGIPTMALGLRSYSSASEDECLLHLEDSWRHLVDSPEVRDSLSIYIYIVYQRLYSKLF